MRFHPFILAPLAIVLAACGPSSGNQGGHGGPGGGMPPAEVGTIRRLRHVCQGTHGRHVQ